MTARWFTEEQVQKVARDLQENDRTMADAMDMPSVGWKELSEAQQRRWVNLARVDLAILEPLDITRPIRLRDGMPVYDVKLSEDGLNILARVIAWGQEGTQASWGRDGRSGEADHPTDLVYA
jgi:hypothetical protein